jgi:putative tricarboxylic transport membrane protein
MKFFNNKEKVGSAFVLLFALIYLNATFDIPVHKMIFIEIFNARTLPMFLAIATIIICLVLIFMPGGGLSDETMTDAVAGFQWKPCLLLTVLMLLYGLTFNFFGFLLATFLFLFIGFSILEEKRYRKSATVAGAVAFFMWAVVTQMFYIYIVSGDLYRLVVAG